MGFKMKPFQLFRSCDASVKYLLSRCVSEGECENLNNASANNNDKNGIMYGVKAFVMLWGFSN